MIDCFYTCIDDEGIRRISSFVKSKGGEVVIMRPFHHLDAAFAIFITAPVSHTFPTVNELFCPIYQVSPRTTSHLTALNSEHCATYGSKMCARPWQLPFERETAISALGQ